MECDKFKFIFDVTHDPTSPLNAQDLILLENNKVISIDEDKVMLWESLEAFNTAKGLPEPDHVIWTDFKTVKTTPKTCIPSSKMNPLQLKTILIQMGESHEADKGFELVEEWWKDTLKFQAYIDEIPDHILNFQRQDPDCCVVCEYLAMFHDYLDVIK